MEGVASTPKYRRLVELGRGGMAVVSLAAMRSSHNVTKLVVIKELERGRATDPEFRQMFLEEARLAARLNHPNVVQMFEIVDHVDGTIAARPDGLEGVCALIMEYLDGQPFNRVRSRLKDDPTALALYLAVLVDVLTGLEYAHTLADYDGKPLGLVHRDVSPHNVFVTYSGEVKVLDFGIAKANDTSIRPTDVGVVKGKLSYMAPEQARGERVDARADVFACGIMLWESAVGKRLWAGMNDPAIMYNLQSGTIPAPREINPDVPEALDAICRRALARSPTNRYASAGALRDALEAYVETLPGRPNRRAIGERMVRLFEEERSQVRKIVEDQLGKVANASTDEFASASLASVALPRVADSSISGVGDPTQSMTSPTQASTSLSVSPPTAQGKRPLLLIAVVMLAVLSSALSVFVLLRSQHETPLASRAPPLTTSAPIATAPVSAAPVQSATASASTVASASAAPSSSRRPSVRSAGTVKTPSTATTAAASPTDIGY